MLPDPDEAVIWRGPRKNGLIKQFLRDVDWGPLDFLVVDAPPGTSDEHITIAQARALTSFQLFRRGSWGGGKMGGRGGRSQSAPDPPTLPPSSPQAGADASPSARALSDTPRTPPRSACAPARRTAR